MNCKRNMEYMHCGNPCKATCTDPTGENCGEIGTCAEGCFCVEGYVYDSNLDRCIAASECGCFFENQYLSVGYEFITSNCSRHCGCYGAGQNLTCEDIACVDNSFCSLEKGKYRCRCNPNYIQEGGQCVGKQCRPQINS